MTLPKIIFYAAILFFLPFIRGQNELIPAETVRVVDILSFDNPITVQVFKGDNGALLETHTIQPHTSSSIKTIAQKISPLDAKKRYEYEKKIGQEYKDKTFITLQQRHNGKWDWIKVTEHHQYYTYKPSGNDHVVLLYVGPDTIHGIEGIHKLEVP